MVGYGWLGFNGTFSTNRPHRAIKKIKVCYKDHNDTAARIRGD